MAALSLMYNITPAIIATMAITDTTMTAGSSRSELSTNMAMISTQEQWGFNQLHFYLWQYGSIIKQIDLMGVKRVLRVYVDIRGNPREYPHILYISRNYRIIVQCHSRCANGNQYTAFYLRTATVCTVSEIRRLIGQESQFFALTALLLSLDAPCRISGRIVSDENWSPRDIRQ